MTKKIELLIKTTDINFLQELFDEHEVLPGKKLIVGNGIDIELLSTSHRPGISESEAVINIAIGIAGGIPASLIASWVYDKIGKKEKNQVLLKEEKEILITAKEFEIYFRKKIEKSVNTVDLNEE